MRERSIPEEVSSALLAGFDNDPALAAALATNDPEQVDNALVPLWRGPSTLGSSIAVQKWTDFRDARA